MLVGIIKLSRVVIKSGDNYIEMCYQQTTCYVYLCFQGSSWWLSGKESICNGGDAGSIPGVQKDSLEKEMATFLPGKFSGQRSLSGYSP